MRAFYTPDIDINTKSYTVDGEDFTHYSKVLRGKVGHNVVLMNGDGLCAYGTVIELHKKSLLVSINDVKLEKRRVRSELVLGIPKKDYLSDILKMATEVGVAHIHLFVSDNTPWKFSYSERFDKILKAGILQSNNPFMPKISIYKSLNDYLETNSQVNIQGFLTEIKECNTAKDCQSVLVGPEGGFSTEEIDLLKSKPNVHLKKLPNPIMRSVTAAVFALGHIQRD